MNEQEVRLRCLELAYQMSRQQNIFTPEGIAELAKVLYSFTQEPLAVEKRLKTADKLKREIPDKASDIFE